MNLIFLGDSLMQVNGPETYPQKGWPQALDSYLINGVQILDFAKNGRSTKSFLDEGLFQVALDNAQPGDVALLGFSHNDEKPDEKRHTDPNTSFKNNLIYMMDEFKKKDVKRFVLCTPISRLRYDPNGQLLHSHGLYAEAIRDLARTENIPLLDLEKLTFHDLSKRPEKECKKFYMCFGENEYPNYPKGSEDTTHLSEAGAKWICSLAVPHLKNVSSLAKIFA